MARKQRKSSRGRVSAIDREVVGPTPETLAKLQADPFNVLVILGMLDTAQRDAGLEIRAIWYAITGRLMAKCGERSPTRGGDGMSEKLAQAHALVYLPWARYWGRLIEEVIDLVVDARIPDQAATRADLGNLGEMLEDYARRRRRMGRLRVAA